MKNAEPPPQRPQFDELMRHFTPITGQRRINKAHITCTQDLCGYSVPRTDFISVHNTLVKYAEKCSPEDLAQRQAEQTTSIDGLTVSR